MYNHEFEAIFFKRGQSIVVFNYKNLCKESIWLGSTPAIRDVIDPKFTSRTSNTLKCLINGMVSFGGEQTGDCGNEVCGWPVPNSLVTILNFTINQQVQTNPLIISYELNLNHRHNVPVRIQPVGGSLVGGGTGPCHVVDCAQDFRNVGSYVGCHSACDALKDAKHCCFGDFASYQTCQPNGYSSIFKKVCGLAHTYPGDNQPPIYSCSGATSFNITFCPAYFFLRQE
ncbi:hypothetical protein ACJW30_09G037600 [Castanea mollissima]